MNKRWAAAATLVVLAGCTAPVATPSPAPPPAAPPTTAESPATPTESGPPTSQNPTTPTPDAGPVSPAFPTPASPTSAAPLSDLTLEQAFAQPENGGIGAFLRAHPDYLPGTVVIGEVIVSGAARGPLELTLRNVPPGTTRMFMTIACTESKPYRMELTRADGSAAGASWADSCGYWGGLNGYTTTPFDPFHPPTRFTITVAPDTRYSYVLYASPGR